MLLIMNKQVIILVRTRQMGESFGGTKGSMRYSYVGGYRMSHHNHSSCGLNNIELIQH